jgi:prevent-host-death family protein
MKMISDREFRNQPGKVRKELAEQDVIMTSRGKPYAVLLPVRDQSEVEQVLELASRIRAQMALSSVRGKAAEADLNEIPDSELEEEIEHVRKQRRE